MNFICKLYFYDKKLRLQKTVSSIDAHWFTTELTESLLNTHNEYYIILTISTITNISFIEVFHEETNTFIARHFVRNNQLSPLVSFEESRTDCQLIRLPHTTSTPKLNWKRILSDSFWTNFTTLKLSKYATKRTNA